MQHEKKKKKMLDRLHVDNRPENVTETKKAQSNFTKCDKYMSFQRKMLKHIYLFKCHILILCKPTDLLKSSVTAETQKRFVWLKLNRHASQQRQQMPPWCSYIVKWENKLMHNGTFVSREQERNIKRQHVLFERSRIQSNRLSKYSVFQHFKVKREDVKRLTALIANLSIRGKNNSSLLFGPKQNEVDKRRFCSSNTPRVFKKK